MNQFPKLSKTRRIMAGAIFVFGFILGAFVLFSAESKDVISKLFFGMMAGFVLVYLTTPELMKFLIDRVFQRNLSELRKVRLKKAKKLRFWRTITHFTTLPQSLAFGLWILAGLVYVIVKIEMTESIFLSIMFLTALLLGISGILMIIHRKAVVEYGHLIRGFRAVFYGIFLLIISLMLVFATLKISTFQ